MVKKSIRRRLARSHFVSGDCRVCSAHAWEGLSPARLAGTVTSRSYCNLVLERAGDDAFRILCLSYFCDAFCLTARIKVPINYDLKTR